MADTTMAGDFAIIPVLPFGVRQTGVWPRGAYRHWCASCRACYCHRQRGSPHASMRGHRVRTRAC